MRWDCFSLWTWLPNFFWWVELFSHVIFILWIVKSKTIFQVKCIENAFSNRWNKCCCKWLKEMQHLPPYSQCKYRIVTVCNKTWEVFLLSQSLYILGNNVHVIQDNWQGFANPSEFFTLKRTVSHRCEYTPHIFVNILLYFFIWQHWRNDTLLQCEVVSVQLQRLCLGNRHMSAASIAAEVEGVGGQPAVLRPYAKHCIKLVCMAVVPEGSLF